MKKIVAIGLGLLIISSLGLAGSKQPKKIKEAQAKQEINIINFLPNKTVSGEKIAYDKKLYLLDVWATWCPPCRQTVPELIALQNKYEAQGFTVLGLSVDQSSAPVGPFIKKYGINYPVAMGQEAMRVLPPVRGIPTMFLVAANGNILKQYVGYTSKERMAKDIDAIIKKINKGGANG